ncbi:MAG: Cellulosome-anchoring protein precursor [Firmicutes bacterium ADurb.Bin373]|nr:S-layer homology domain-containing protein [Bacillota bacterium]OQA07410.1 MAG: Cellulosome-anchoring protein precursor [Firmicutes bacterium ADurb.Bin373]
MKTRFLSRRLVFLTILVCSLIFLPLAVTFDRAEAEPLLADRAAQYLKNEYAKNGVINADMGVGSHAFYLLATAGVDAGAWNHDGISLADAVISAIQSDIANAGQVPAKRLAQDLAAAKTLGRENLADQLLLALKNRQDSEGFDKNGPLSVYSNIPAFEILSRIGLLDRLDTGLARSYVLGMQYAGTEDKYRGSWGSTDNGLFYADFMAVTGAVRMLSRMDPGGSDAGIREAVSSGLDWLKRQQQPGGNFMAGMDDTLIDTCDVIVTLKELGIDPGTWVSSAGKSPVDYLMSEALNPDGSFGQSQNAMDAVWVLWACRALGEDAETQPAVQAQVQQVQPAQQEQPATIGQTKSAVQPAPPSFKDTAGHWAWESISRMAEKGITAGYSDGSFKPEAQVTRNEIAAMIVRLLQPAPASAQDVQLINDSFADAGDIPVWALEAAAVALREGLVSGCPQQDGSLSFAGGKAVNRAELSVMMARVIEMKLGQAEPKVLDFADNNLIPDWAGRSVGIVYARGIAGGYPDRTFQAEKAVTRAEAASMIMRLADQIDNK